MDDELDRGDRAVIRLLTDAPIANDPARLEQALIAYRNSRTGRKHSRRLSRHAMRLATVTTVSVLSGSLAAGYAAALPDPVQRAVHHIFGHVGVPAPATHHRHTPVKGQRATPPSADHVATRPTRAPQDVVSPPHPNSPQLQIAAGGRETAGSTTSAVATFGTRHLLPDGHVQLQAASREGGPWHVLLSGTPDHAGQVRFDLPAFRDNTWVRVADGHEVSASHLIVVIPTVIARWSRSADGQLILRLTVTGASAGDTLTVSDASIRGSSANRHALLDRQGSATITYAARPPGTDHFAAHIDASTRHGGLTVALPPPPSR